MAYLYGASVQGIQGFIFESNVLKEIVGGSEIIKALEEDVEELKDTYGLSEQPEIILNAAGNIRLEIEKKEDVKKIFKSFPKDVMQKAYGITISQAVVKKKDEKKDPRSKLEKLLKEKRNQVTLPLDMSINILKLAPKNARPIVNEKDMISQSTQQKIGKFEKLFKGKDEDEKYKNISNISNKKNKIAIIHADGNGLGDIVRDFKGDMSKFSEELNNATESAYDEAVKKVGKDKFKIRKVILGGDDLAVICDADYAIEFVKYYLQCFEKETNDKEHIPGKLTACAGIAFCNEKYPFHYAIALAEELCGYAKDASNREKSCVMFHNIQGSHYESYEKFIDDELTVYGDEDKKKIYFNFGPYYLSSDTKPTIDDFETLLKLFRKDESPLSGLRTWIEELHNNQAHAQILLDRINSNIDKDKWNADGDLKNLYEDLSMKNLLVEKDEKCKTPIYDILQVYAATSEVKS